MLSSTTRRIVKDCLMISGVMILLSGAYLGFAWVERYRGLTAAYLQVSQQLIVILNQQAAKEIP